ncbi:TetR family transcriptional regulator [Jiangella mangrovi]|uniref:AcrR family transcriptional regulator n=1 Tax=Jiangella mangrovi TaxID=1524084 RepID=A0A7W9LMN0_9ACTN|nr:AcrR family transcriptional regulator [Jiangella mangrovi]
MIDAAAELFAAHGYARTTLARIAEAAQVSVETVQAQGPKRSLLGAAVRMRTFGREADESILDVPESGALLRQDRPDGFARAAARLVGEINARSSGLMRAFASAAADDPDIEAEWSEVLGLVHGNVRDLVALLGSRGWLRSDAGTDELAAGLWIMIDGEVFEKLTRRLGWSAQHYEDWLARSIGDLLFPARPA